VRIAEQFHFPMLARFVSRAHHQTS
jgi:hypothetical protein